jgi:hypothetical protein
MKLVSLLRRLRKAGGTEATVQEQYDRMRETARTEGWRPSELATSVADWHDAIERTYGKRAAARITGH